MKYNQIQTSGAVKSEQLEFFLREPVARAFTVYEVFAVLTESSNQGHQ